MPDKNTAKECVHPSGVVHSAGGKYQAVSHLNLGAHRRLVGPALLFPASRAASSALSASQPPQPPLSAAPSDSSSCSWCPCVDFRVDEVGAIKAKLGGKHRKLGHFGGYAS